MPTSFDSVSIAIARLNARVEAMGTRIAAMEEKQSSDMLQVFSAIEKLARSIDNLKSSVNKSPNPHDQPIRQNLTPLVPTSTENEEVISAEFGSNHQHVSLETVGKSQGAMKSEIIFRDLNGLEYSCLLPVCGYDSVKLPCAFVISMDSVGTQYSIQSHYTAALGVKPPPKPPDVIKLDETLDLRLSFGASYLILNLCSPSVCKSALMVWPSHSSIQMDSVGGFNGISNPKIETTFVKPPAKPPDDFFICAPLDVKVWIEIATSYINVHLKSCDMIFECLSLNMCEFDLKKSGGGSGLEDKNEPVCLNMVLHKGNEKEFAVKKIFLMILMKMKVIAKPPDESFNLLQVMGTHIIFKRLGIPYKYVILYSFNGVLGGRLAYIYVVMNKYGSGYYEISHLIPVGIFIDLYVQWNVVKQADAIQQFRKLRLQRNSQVCPSPSLNQSFDTFPNVLNLPLTSTVFHHGKIRGIIFSIHGLLYGLSVLEIYSHIIIAEGLIVADYAMDIKLDSAVLFQPVNMARRGDVGFKGFAKFVFYNELTKLVHDIIIIEGLTESTSPLNFSVTFDTGWVKPCKSALKVKPWLQTCLTQDPGTSEVNLDQSKLQRYISEPSYVNFCCSNSWFLTSHPLPIEWNGSLFRLVYDEFLNMLFNSVMMRCLLASISFSTDGCCVKPPIFKASSTGMVGLNLYIDTMTEFMVTSQRIVKEGPVSRIQGLQILCFPTRQNDYDFLLYTSSSQVALLVTYRPTLFFWTNATMDLELKEKGRTELKGLLHFLLQCIHVGGSGKSSCEKGNVLFKLRKGLPIGNHQSNSYLKVVKAITIIGEATAQHDGEVALVVGCEHILGGGFPAETDKQDSPSDDYIETLSNYGNPISAKLVIVLASMLTQITNVILIINIWPTTLTGARCVQPLRFYGEISTVSESDVSPTKGIKSLLHFAGERTILGRPIYLAASNHWDKAGLTMKLRNNSAALLAWCWYWPSYGVDLKDIIVLPYKDKLLVGSMYLQQVVVELIGKDFILDGKMVLQGLVVYGNKGSTYQHAYIQ